MKSHLKISLGLGFTLIELLVVIAIISFIASIVLYGVNTARAKGRDTKRLADIKQLSTALDLYYNENGAYPLCTAAIAGGDPYCGDCDPASGNSQFLAALQPLITSGILNKIPQDPLNSTGCYTYEYYTSNQADIWAGQCANVPVGQFFYIIRFGTERDKTFNIPAWIYQRVTGKEYCFVGYR